MTAEMVTYGGIKYAEVIRAGVRIKKTQFLSPPESSFQFGLLTSLHSTVNESGNADYGKPKSRLALQISACQIYAPASSVI